MTSPSQPSSRQYRVFRIENGTVIDHIPHWNAIKVLNLLGLHGTDSLVTVGFGMNSAVMGRKDLVKVENRELTVDEINRVALVAPKATINRIESSEIVDKFIVRLPDLLRGLVRCPNPGCITHSEPAPGLHNTLGREPLRLSCHYCLHVTLEHEIELLW